MKYITIIPIIFFVCCYSKQPEKTGMEGKPMPSFSILLPDSTSRFDTKNLPIGEPTVFVLFGPNCPYSKAQILDIVENIKQLKDIKIFLITPYSYQQMKMLYDEYKLKNYANITVGVDSLNFFGQYMRASAVPYTVIYTKDKLLDKAFLGKINTIQIKEIVEN